MNSMPRGSSPTVRPPLPTTPDVRHSRGTALATSSRLPAWQRNAGSVPYPERHPPGLRQGAPGDAGGNGAYHCPGTRSKRTTACSPRDPGAGALRRRRAASGRGRGGFVRASAALLGSLRSPRRAAEPQSGHFTCSENRTLYLLPTPTLTALAPRPPPCYFSHALPYPKGTGSRGGRSPLCSSGLRTNSVSTIC